MKAEDPFSGYFLVATRIDQETGMKYEIHAKRDMTEWTCLEKVEADFGSPD